MSNIPQCAVRGMLQPNAACGHVIVGAKLCGYPGQCQHQQHPEAVQEAGYHITGQCGREWFVPIAAVGRDYAEFLMQNDGLSEADAVTQSESVRDDFWKTWFSEQCCHWVDVERLGRLVQPVGRFKTKKANDGARGNLQFAKIEYQAGSE